MIFQKLYAESVINFILVDVKPGNELILKFEAVTMKLEQSNFFQFSNKQLMLAPGGTVWSESESSGNLALSVLLTLIPNLLFSIASHFNLFHFSYPYE